MKKLRLMPLFLLCIAILNLLTPITALADADPLADLVETQPEITAWSAVLVEQGTGKVFYAKDENIRVAPASLTKMMTVLLAVEAIDEGRAELTSPVTATESSQYDLIEDGSTLQIAPGETLSLEDLMYGAMVASANEACNIIAEHIEGSAASFIERMNDRARELGCTGTRFMNTHGLPDDNHYTTAWDMYLIAQEAMKHPVFAEIVGTKQYTIEATNMTEEPRVFGNTNALLGDSEHFEGYTYEHAIGIKTGHTDAAGRCLASAAKKDDMELISVVMGSTAEYDAEGKLIVNSFKDTVTLYEWAFNNFSYQDILRSSEVITSVPIEMGSDADNITLRPKETLMALLPNNMNKDSFKRDIIVYSERDNEDLMAPIEAGQVLGEITVSLGDHVYGTVPLVAAATVDLSRLAYIKGEISKTMSKPLVKGIIITLIVLFALYLALVIRYRIQRIRHVRSMRQARKQQAQEGGDIYASAKPKRGAKAEDEDDVDLGYYADNDDYYDIPAPDFDELADEEDQAPAADRDYYEEFFK